VFLAAGTSLLLFALLLGPVWERHYDVDRAIGWSYLIVPPLVAFLLARRGALTWPGWALGTLAVAITKFAISALMVVAIWAIWGPAHRAPERTAPQQPPPPAAEERLEASPIEIENDGRGFGSGTRVLRAGQPLVLRALDGKLHTLRAIDGRGRAVFNLPVLPWADPPPRPTPDVAGHFRAGCTVHPEEPESELVVVRAR
jgi:hypothetical protein